MTFSLDGLVLLILSVLLLSLVPVWPHSRPWGYHPAGVVTIAVAVALMAMMMG